jgi:hypothetical protein
MDERDILDCIRHLIAEEHRMRVAQAGRSWSAETLSRLHEVQRSLEDLWGELRRVRAEPAA